MTFLDVDPPSLPPEFSSKLNVLYIESAKLRVVCLKSQKYVSKSESNCLTIFYGTKCSYSDR